MEKPKDWPVDFAPPDAYYNGMVRDPGEDYDIARKKYGDGVAIISWCTKYLKLWDMLMNNDYGIPLMVPPPLFIDRSDDTPYKIDPSDGGKLQIIAHMAESWANVPIPGSEYSAAGRTFYQLRVYERVILKEIKALAGKTPTLGAVNAILDRLLLHESSHFIRNTIMWMRCYDDSPGDYEDAYNNLIQFTNAMGSTDDERDTEALALRLFRNYYFPCFDGLLSTVQAVSPWIRRYVDRHPIMEDAALVYEYYDINWQDSYGFKDGPTKQQRKAMADRQDEIIEILHKHGDKHGQKIILIQ